MFNQPEKKTKNNPSERIISLAFLSEISVDRAISVVLQYVEHNCGYLLLQGQSLGKASYDCQRRTARTLGWQSGFSESS